MNKQQLQKIINNRQRTIAPELARGIELVLIDGLSAYAAEKQVYGNTTGTVGRAAKEIMAQYNFCLEVSALS